MSGFSHLDDQNRLRMIDISGKEDTRRTAVATGTIDLEEAYAAARDQHLAKGDLLTTATIAGIQGAKQTSSLIPLCHPLPLSSVNLDFRFADDTRQLTVTATAMTTGKTGVEMEALTAVSVALLTVYDMCKAITHRMTIHSIRVLRKEGGRSGTIDFTGSQP